MFTVLLFLVAAASVKVDFTKDSPGTKLLEDVLQSEAYNDVTPCNETSFIKLLGISKTKPDKFESKLIDFISQQDYETTKKIISVAKRKMDDALRPKHYRRYSDTELRKPGNSEMVAHIVFKLMKQSIYNTRYRLRDILWIRKRFSENIGYNMALLYGGILQMRNKMTMFYAMMYHLRARSPYDYYIMLYEKMLAINVDITNTVQKMFEYDDEYATFIKERVQTRINNDNISKSVNASDFPKKNSNMVVLLRNFKETKEGRDFLSEIKRNPSRYLEQNGDNVSEKIDID